MKGVLKKTVQKTLSLNINGNGQDNSNKQNKIKNLFKKSCIFPESQKKANFFASFKVKRYTKYLLLNLQLWRQKRLKDIHYKMIGDLSGSHTKTINDEEEYNSEWQKYSELFQNYCLNNRFTIIIIEAMYFIPVFSQMNIMKQIWDYMQLLIVGLYFFFIPIKIITTLTLQQLLYSELYYLTLVLIGINIPVKANSGFYEKGEYIGDRMIILKHYIKSDFVYDLATFMLLIFEGSIWDFLLIFYFYQLQYCLVMFNRLEETFLSNDKNIHYLKLVRLLLFVLSVAHVFSTLWIFVAQQDTTRNNWLEANAVFDKNWKDQYIKAFYYVITTMCTVGYGDIHPYNLTEMVICTCMMLIACGVYAFCINFIGAIFEDINRKAKMITEKMITINNYMSRKHVSKELQYKVKQYLDFYWNQAANQSELEQGILQDLSQDLREKLKQEAYQQILTVNPIFKNNFSNRFRNKCIDIIQERYISPGEIIQDNIDNYIYFIDSGSVEYVQEINKKKDQECEFRSIFVLKKNQFFGHLGFFTGQVEQYQIRSQDFTKLIVIKREDFIHLLQKFPQDYERFCEIKDSMFNGKNYGEISYYCPSCQTDSHHLLSCKMAQYVPSKFKLIQQHNRYMNERDKLFKRKRKQKDAESKTLSNIVQIVTAALNCFQGNESFIMNQSWILQDPSFNDSFEEEFDENEDEDDQQNNKNEISLVEEENEDEENKDSEEENIEKKKQAYQANKQNIDDDNNNNLILQEQMQQNVPEFQRKFTDRTQIEDYDINLFNIVNFKNITNQQNQISNTPKSLVSVSSDKKSVKQKNYKQNFSQSIFKNEQQQMIQFKQIKAQLSQDKLNPQQPNLQFEIQSPKSPKSYTSVSSDKQSGLLKKIKQIYNQSIIKNQQQQIQQQLNQVQSNEDKISNYSEIVSNFISLNVSNNFEDTTKQNINNLDMDNFFEDSIKEQDSREQIQTYNDKYQKNDEKDLYDDLKSKSDSNENMDSDTEQKLKTLVEENKEQVLNQTSQKEDQNVAQQSRNQPITQSQTKIVNKIPLQRTSLTRRNSLKQNNQIKGFGKNEPQEGKGVRKSRGSIFCNLPPGVKFNPAKPDKFMEQAAMTQKQRNLNSEPISQSVQSQNKSMQISGGINQANHHSEEQLALFGQFIKKFFPLDQENAGMMEIKQQLSPSPRKLKNNNQYDNMHQNSAQSQLLLQSWVKQFMPEIPENEKIKIMQQHDVVNKLNYQQNQIINAQEQFSQTTFLGEENFESVRSYKFYYPKQNVEQIMVKFKKYQMSKRQLQQKLSIQNNQQLQQTSNSSDYFLRTNMRKLSVNESNNKKFKNVIKTLPNLNKIKEFNDHQNIFQQNSQNNQVNDQLQQNNLQNQGQIEMMPTTNRNHTLTLNTNSDLISNIISLNSPNQNSPLLKQSQEIDIKLKTTPSQNNDQQIESSNEKERNNTQQTPKLTQVINQEQIQEPPPIQQKKKLGFFSKLKNNLKQKAEEQ